MSREDDAPLGLAARMIFCVDVAGLGLGEEGIDERLVHQKLRDSDGERDDAEHDGHDVGSQTRSSARKVRRKLHGGGDDEHDGHDLGEADQPVTGDGEGLYRRFVRPTVPKELIFQPFLRLALVGHTRFARTYLLADVLDGVKAVIHRFVANVF